MLVLLSRPPEAIREEILRDILVSRSLRVPATELPAFRKDNVADALGSVMAEGLEPSGHARADALAYEAGDMTADELCAAALDRARAAGRQ
jgi:hypothetical protein